MSSDLKNDLASLFKPAKPRILEESSSQNVSTHQSSKEIKDSYRKSNQSLVLKIHRLEVDLARSRKIIEELRAENALLKKTIYDSENLEFEERIEALSNERIKRKMDQLSCIGSRTISSLQMAAVNLKKAFEDFGVHINNSLTTDEVVTRSKRSTLSSEGQSLLNTVIESPPLVVSSDVVSSERNGVADQEEETPYRCNLNIKKSRRSDLFHSYEMKVDVLETFSAEDTPTPTNTPPTYSKRLFFETPAVPFVECDTGRRKRTATLKIKSLAEPRLNSKMRRPGRNEEPHQFISSLY